MIFDKSTFGLENRVVYIFIKKHIFIRNPAVQIKMSVAEFLKGLPSFDESNFTKFHVDTNNRSPLKRPSVYVPTKDYPSEQVIVTEKTSILLRYLHQHWEKKNLQKKRDHTTADIDDQIQARKRPRHDFNTLP